ncbi:MAG: hypothetical protein AB1485_03495 [Candidatus Thermoplasmatota archaeon]
MEVEINKIVFLLVALIPFIIYLNYSLHLPQTLSSATYEKMNFLQIVVATGIFYLPMVLGIYAVVARNTFTVILFTASMLAVAILPIKELGFVEVVKLIIFSIMLLWFVEWTWSYVKLARIKVWDKLAKPYLCGTSLLMLPITLLAMFVLAFGWLVSYFSVKLSESLELETVYGIFISSCVILGIIAVIKIWKK